jgi:hypothetical protein
MRRLPRSWNGLRIIVRTFSNILVRARIAGHASSSYSSRSTTRNDVHGDIDDIAVVTADYVALQQLQNTRNRVSFWLGHTTDNSTKFDV